MTLALLVSHGTFAGLTGPEWHAALNDFPVALLVASVVFDLMASGRHQDPLRAAAYWTLIVGAGSAILAVVSGLLAEGRFEQTTLTHRMIETHEALGISLAVLFVALAAWRAWRRNQFSEPERQSYTVAALVGALALLWSAHLGGTMVYRHAAGIPSSTLQAELKERADSAAGAESREP